MVSLTSIEIGMKKVERGDNWKLHNNNSVQDFRELNANKHEETKGQSKTTTKGGSESADIRGLL